MIAFGQPILKLEHPTPDSGRGEVEGSEGSKEVVVDARLVHLMKESI